MLRIVSLVGRRLTSDAWDHAFAEKVTYLFAIVLLVCGIRGLEKFDLVGGQYFLGLLGVLNIAILLVVLGSIMGLSKRSVDDRKSSTQS